jgi:hypothetical protein
LEKAEQFFISTKIWKPYSGVGHLGKIAMYADDR